MKALTVCLPAPCRVLVSPRAYTFIHQAQGQSK